ncbi:hypothetical protein [Halorubrum xinjiangense]|nr:hypothetical protein [Halorubrum xinjiangense]
MSRTNAPHDHANVSAMNAISWYRSTNAATLLSRSSTDECCER